jgi:hypothetical protein
VNEEALIKIKKRKRRNKNSTKRFFNLTLVNNDFNYPSKVFLSIKLNKNFSQRERLYDKYERVFKDEKERINSIYKFVEEKYKEKFEKIV